MKSALLDFILSHPDTWEEELAATPYCLKISYDEELVMFKYNQLESDFSLPEVREARGIIFNYTTWECVCRAFDKFGNYGESYVPEIDWDTAFVSEKIDGSLIKLYPCDNEWCVATNGTIHANKAEVGDAYGHTFGQLFNEVFWDHFENEFDIFDVFDSNKCYMFELVSPYTTVVVPHERTDLYFLGSRDLTTGKEYTFAEEVEIAKLFKTPRVFPMTKLDEVTDAASALPWDDEGYVVCDANKNRCKIKSPAYVRAHYMRTNGVVTLKRLVSVLLNNEQEEFLIYAPEWQEAIFKILSAMEHLSTTAYVGTVAFKLFNFKNKKEYYNFVSSNIGNKEVMTFLLKLYDRPDFTWQEYTENWDVHRWTRCLENEVEI